MNRLPELLSPAGGAPAMIAAVQCGADAVYLGAGSFNARRTAENFGGGLDAAVGYCHARGVKVYVTLNTMVREDEYPLLMRTIDEISRSGADAVIVQDFGVARAVRACAPQIKLHASTQMAVHNVQGVEFLLREGFDRVVLAREMTYDEIRRCADTGAELEVFVHGALCVACSGQCLMSSMIGGRSGNRGMCAQPCRMRYRADGRDGYFLSTRDLCGLDGLRALIDAGAASLKIEGRLKRPEYVGETTRVYRAALTAIRDGAPFDAGAAKRDLMQMFNRGGFTRGYGFSVDDSELMYAERPNHLGLTIGVCRKSGTIDADAPIDSRDALALRRGGTDIPVRGADFSAARTGDLLIRLVSEAQAQSVRAQCAGENRKIPVNAAISLRVGMPAKLTLTDGAHTVSETGEAVAAAASRPADPERVRAQIGKLGDTPLTLTDISFDMDANAFAPASMLNALRRGAADRLLNTRMGKGQPALPIPRPRKNETVYPDVPEILVQSADPDVLTGCGADGAIFAPADVRPEALTAAEPRLPEAFALAIPPVLAETSLRALNEWALRLRDRITATYVSNIGDLACKWPGRLIADYTMNAASLETLARLAEWGIDCYTPSVELNCAQIDALGGERQLIVHGRIPLMYLRHCPYRAIHGLAGRHSECRRCDRCAAAERADQMTLTDRTGAAFPLRRLATPDGCVLRLLNSVPLMLLRKAKALPRANAWRLILESDAEKYVRLYRAAARGGDVRRDPAWAEIEAVPATTGHYFRGVE